MANERGGFKFFAVVTVAVLMAFGSCNVGSAKLEEEEEDSSPLMEMAQMLLQESVRNRNGGGSGLNALSGVFQGLVQSEVGKQLGDALTKGNSGAAVDVIANLASMWQSSKFNDGQADETGSKQDQTMDPSLAASIMDLFSTLNKASSDAEDNNDNQAFKKESRPRRQHQQQQQQQQSSADWDAILSLAGNVISSMSNTNRGTDEKVTSTGGLESFLSFLPVLLNSMTGQHNSHSSRSIPHHTHSSFLPPFLENLHEYWDHFLSTEFGRTLWRNSGLSDLAKAFTDDKGHLETEKIFESLENNSSRRRWIKSSARFVAEWMKHFTDPEIQRSYLETAQIVCNGFLTSQGYPKETLLDFNRPAKSISSLTNAIFKNKFDLIVNSETYVEPAVGYIQELFRAGQKTGLGFFKGSIDDMESRLAETIDRDVIEPILRVNRAYRFASARPECAEYVICTVNKKKNGSDKSSLKPGITKLSSLAASWFLAGSESTLFWDLYNAASDEKSCKKYDKICTDFDAKDIKATTEYFHNEL